MQDRSFYEHTTHDLFKIINVYVILHFMQECNFYTKILILLFHIFCLPFIKIDVILQFLQECNFYTKILILLFLVTFSQIWYLFIFMSVGWDVKWYFVSCTRISVALNKMFFCSKLAKNAKDQNVKNELWKNSTSNFRCYRYSNKWKGHFLNTRFILPIEESFVLRSLWPFPVLFGCVPHTTSSSEIFCWLTAMFVYGTPGLSYMEIK